VYIREAHPDSVLYVTGKDGEQTLERIAQTETLADRSEDAEKCRRTLNLSIPTLVDREDNAAGTAYAGWPDRIVIVGRDGAIAYKSGPGPAGFKPGELEAWLAEYSEREGRFDLADTSISQGAMPCGAQRDVISCVARLRPRPLRDWGWRTQGPRDRWRASGRDGPTGSASSTRRPACPSP
jgi:hypothetical protein